MGTENPAVTVRLVDDDVAQRRQQPRPLLVAWQHRPVQHVRIGQHEPAEVAGEPALDGVGVAVEGAHPPARKAEGFADPELVVREGLGRGEVEGRVPPAEFQWAALGHIEPQP